MGTNVEWIRRGLEKPGKTQTGLANALHRDRAQITRLLKGDRQLKASEIEIIENYLGMRLPAGGLEDRTAIFGEPAPPPSSQPRGKVYALAADGVGGFLVNLDADPAQFDPLPPRHAAVKGLFGIIVIDETMAPRFKPGEIAWCHPHRPPRAGDDALFLETGAGYGAAAMRLGELIGASSAHWRARAYTPREDFTLPRHQWRALLILPRE